MVELVFPPTLDNFIGRCEILIYVFQQVDWRLFSYVYFILIYLFNSSFTGEITLVFTFFFITQDHTLLLTSD